MDVYSNALNYNSRLNGIVDTRTGQYVCRIALATLYPQGPLEISREIALSFSMLNSGVSGNYGAGWRLENTEFDLATSKLTLLTGEQYQTHGLPSVGRTLVIKDRKLKDLVVKRVGESTLHVIYKDGTIEILGRPSSSGPYKITDIQFENGERLRFSYFQGGPLERIQNDKGQDLLVLTYIGALLVEADALIDGGRYARTRIVYGNANNQLLRVTVPYDRTQAPESVAYTFVYRSPFRNGLIAISEVNSPMGGNTLISYEENGHQYANNEYIPRVVGWRQTPGANQPPVGRKYSYSSGTNFTGYPYSGGFTPGEDNLYRIAGTYDYWGEETVIDLSNNDAPLCATRMTYNKFHLLTEERVTREGTRATTSFAYNIIPRKLFPDQPANLQLPRQVVKRFEMVAGGSAREEVQTIETDDYGNELSRTEASGVRVERNYYPVAGETGKCPADPHGLFQRFVKQERLVPAGGTPAARLTEYTHTRVPQTGSSYFVVQESMTRPDLFSARHTYYDTPVELAGRLKSVSDTIDGLVLASNFTYTVAAGNLVETRRMVGREGQWLESVRTLSLVNRRLLSMTRDGDCSLAFEFDISGRLTAETVSLGKPQQAMRRYAYHFATPDKRAHLITTDAQNNKVITYFDGIGRQVSEAQLIGANYDQERVIRTWRYDALEQLSEVVSHDYLADGPRSLKSTYGYNRWGNSSRVTRADGSVQIDEYDPLLNLRVEGVEGGERLRRYFNEHNQPVKVERLDAGDATVEVESRTYDGLGRCLSVLDMSNKRTEFTYDDFDRALTTLEIPLDGTPQRLQKTDYAPGTSDAMVSALAVDGNCLGARTYDSLCRLTSETRGAGQATIWEYEPGWTEPVAKTSPRGNRQTLTYDKELGVPTHIGMTGLPESTYRYDAIASTLTCSETNGLIHESFQDANGHPEKDIQTANGASLTALYSYSPGGRLLHQTAADGQLSTLEYDIHGRFSRITTGPLVIEQGYDALGRPQDLTTVYQDTRVVTKVSYDALGREAERRFEENGVLLQVMTHTYHANSLLATRFLRDASSRVVIGETFTYDAFLRLKTYRCEGLEQPQDQLGRGIVGQDFSLDSLNNITGVVTTFVDGTQDICERFFSGVDPTQLTRLTHTAPPQDVTLTYDAAGNLQTGPSGQVYTYNAFEQLTNVRAGSDQYNYQYDADSRQVVASRGDEPPVRLAYNGERLELLVEGNKTIRYANGNDQVMAISGGVDGVQLYANDASGSVRGITAPGETHVRRHYTPYGDTKISLEDGKARSMADLQKPGFNGQRLDVATNLYFLGNGMRAYDPGLMMFLQADPLSPYDEGGTNGYAYCACNPINAMDPSGLWPTWLKWVFTGAALALGVVALGIGVAGIAAVGLASANSAQIIGVVGTALGVVGSTLGVTGLSIEAVDVANGWDRSGHIRNLGWAAFGFSMASWAASGYNAWGAASKAFDAGKGIKSVGDMAHRSGYGTVSAREALRSLAKSFGGRTFKVNNRITPGSKAFGSIRAVIRMTNLMRSLNARYAALTSDSAAAEDPGGRVEQQAQPQPQSAMRQFVDTPQSASRYYQSFRDEVTRIRRPITTEAYQSA
ncbi:type IV secretion protein Rhs [Pseudomonas sp. NS1(2017)]|uniref:RHS repeat domain-containing protein n=1 Tax=Pseudomonas sp. NS1(2017) TaxID=2025658 RepID=UPI000BA2151B|nr:RHS repeat-associated core domain-containing protein [Pseudomonas sp. NS1(2017)]ASV40568.1 type IV secretion protein Rhs [Pseudomonas sp. NS1(2017)]